MSAPNEHDKQMRDVDRLVDTLRRYRSMLKRYADDNAHQFLLYANAAQANTGDIVGIPYWEYSEATVLYMLKIAEVSEGKAAEMIGVNHLEVRRRMIERYGESWRDDGAVEHD